jgi:hypothetical protein
MDVFADFATDEEKEVNGVWKEISPGTEVLVARLGNKKYARVLSALVEQHQRVLDLKNEVAEKLSDQIMVEATAQAVLLDWRGDFKFKKTALPYSLENAKTVLAVKDFRALIQKLAGAFDSYRVAQEEAQVKS